MILNVLVTAYAMVVAFVLSSAERNQREARPHGRAIMLAGQVAFNISCALAVLAGGWALLYAVGYVPELPDL